MGLQFWLKHLFIIFIIFLISGTLPIKFHHRLATMKGLFVIFAFQFIVQALSHPLHEAKAKIKDLAFVGGDNMLYEVYKVVDEISYAPEAENEISSNVLDNIDDVVDSFADGIGIPIAQRKALLRERLQRYFCLKGLIPCPTTTTTTTTPSAAVTTTAAPTTTTTTTTTATTTTTTTT